MLLVYKIVKYQSSIISAFRISLMLPSYLFLNTSTQGFSRTIVCIFLGNGVFVVFRYSVCTCEILLPTMKDLQEFNDLEYYNLKPKKMLHRRKTFLHNKFAYCVFYLIVTANPRSNISPYTRIWRHNGGKLIKFH